MAFVDLWNEVTGVVPKMPTDYAKKVVNRAWKDVRRQNLWSFLLFESNWTSPSFVNAGTCTVTQGSDLVVFNGTAAAAITGIGFVPSPVTARQFRIGIGTIYNIWAWDGVNTITLDRNYQEASSAGGSYQIYQVYYPAPMIDWKGWSAITDMLNFNPLRFTRRRSDLNLLDPQRTLYYIPTDVVYYQNDMNPASATYGFPLFELWGPPSYVLTYQLYGSRKGADFTSNTDTLPNAIGEDVVMAKARYYAYEWAEANRGDAPRTQASFTVLMNEANKEYKSLFRQYRQEDRNAVDNWFRRFRRSGAWGNWPNSQGYYSSIGGVANPGSPW